MAVDTVRIVGVYADGQAHTAAHGVHRDGEARRTARRKGFMPRQYGAPPSIDEDGGGRREGRGGRNRGVSPGIADSGGMAALEQAGDQEEEKRHVHMPADEITV